MKKDAFEVKVSDLLPSPQGQRAEGIEHGGKHLRPVLADCSALLFKRRDGDESGMRKEGKEGKEGEKDEEERP